MKKITFLEIILILFTLGSISQAYAFKGKTESKGKIHDALRPSIHQPSPSGGSATFGDTTGVLPTSAPEAADADTFTVVEEVTEDSRSVSEQAGDFVRDLVQTAEGAAEGLSYVAGFGGSQADQRAARAASFQDLTDGRAGSRALGSFDAYARSMTFGLIDPGLRSQASDAGAAEIGEGFGQAGAVGLALIVGRGALGAVRSGASSFGNFVGGVIRAMR